MARKVDEHQALIMEALRTAGATVQSLHTVGHGCPDLLCGYHGMNILMEVKSEKGCLNSNQVVWHREWKGQKAVVRTPEDAIAVLEDCLEDL